MLALSSAVLLVLSFPNFNQPWCAWMALVPWLLLLRTVSRRAAFWWSFCIGVIFFLASMWWLISVTVVGWIVLCAYLALYFGVFGWSLSLVGDRRSRPPNRISGLMSQISCLFFVPSLWVTLEFVRSHALTGLGWNLLAYSQTSWRALIQFADLTGAWGVSFLIAMVNVTIAELIHATRRRAAMTTTAMVMLLIMATLGYGVWRLRDVARSSTMRVAVVQGNVPQTEKWDEAYQEQILTRYDTLTREAVQTRPDLIVWPETSVPGYLGLDEDVTQRIFTLARQVNIPLLVGAPMGHLSGAEWAITNSAALLISDAAVIERYDKLHLVPFGEFVPFDRTVPWLRHLLPPIGDFTPGTKPTVFSISDSERKSTRSFSVLICFEDVFPAIARQFVRGGARLLLVITNDAWFGPTAAAYQHAQTSIFRAVELRVPVVRAANTGWSGCIDPSGRIIGSVHDTAGHELFVSGTHTCDLPLRNAHTLYERWGDWFAWLCLVGILVWTVSRLRSHSRVLPRRHPTRPRRAGLSPSSAPGE